MQIVVAAVIGSYSGTDGVVYAARVSNTQGQADYVGVPDPAPVDTGLTSIVDTDNPVLDIDPGGADRIVINGLNSRLSLISTSDTNYDKL